MALERGAVIDGKYEILKEIGKGGMSVVYLAMDLRLNKQWAVKVIQRRGIGKNNEIVLNKVPDDTELMMRLDHPSIPRIVDIIDRENDPQIYIVMDYVEGDSLDKILTEYGAQPQDLVIDWAKQICDTLGYLHSQKPPIIYRDMKPGNIMLKPEGNLKIIDFGISREYKEQNLADTTILGTRGYAPPEQFGSRQTDARSDIYALGMTMHHLLTGVDPRPKSYEYIPIRQWNPELSSGLERIIDKCTALAPEDRYQNCNELMYDLEHYEEIGDEYKKKQKKKLGVFIGFVALSVIFLGLGILFNSLVANRYDVLVDSKDINQVYKAIEIDRGNIEGYEKALEINESDFGKKELSKFTNYYDNSTLDKNSKEYFDLTYKLGHMIFFNYTDSESFRERITLAGKHFGTIVDSDKKRKCENYENAKTYYSMYKIYNKFEIRHEDPTKEDLEKLIKSFDVCLNQIEESGGNTYTKAVVLVQINELLNDYRKNFARQGIDEDSVEALMDRIDDVAYELKDTATNEDTITQLKRITKNHKKYRAQLEQAYENQEGEGEEDEWRNS